jgi:hypothetical protein
MTPPDQDTKSAPKLTPEQERKILEGPPKGTLFIILMLRASYTLAWLILYVL